MPGPEVPPTETERAAGAGQGPGRRHWRTGVGALTVAAGPEPPRGRAGWAGLGESLRTVAGDTAVVGAVVVAATAVVKTATGDCTARGLLCNVADPWVWLLLALLACLNLFLRATRPHLADQLVQAALYNSVTVAMTLARQPRPAPA
jgi:hypothetical protein